MDDLQRILIAPLLDAELEALVCSSVELERAVSAEDHLTLLELDYARDADRARAVVAPYVDPIALTKMLMAASGWDPARRVSADADPRILPPYLRDRPISAAHAHAVRILEQFGGLVVVVPRDRTRNLSFRSQAPFVFDTEPAVIATDRDRYGAVLVDTDGRIGYECLGERAEVQWHHDLWTLLARILVPEVVEAHGRGQPGARPG